MLWNIGADSPLGADNYIIGVRGDGIFHPWVRWDGGGCWKFFRRHRRRRHPPARTF